MKFTWFNLMPWPYLPDDFREKNRSVWVDIDQRCSIRRKSHEVYNTYMDLLEYAGTIGFDGIGVNEHHQNGYGIMPSPEHHRRGPGAPHQGRRPSWCWATPSPSTIRRSAWPRSSPCWTASPAGGWWRASRSAPRWTPTTATARSRP